MVYLLLHKDIPLIIFRYETEVVEAMIRKNSIDHLPLPLKRITHNKSEFIADENPDFVLNVDGCALFDFWLNDRTIPLDREQAKERYTSGKSAIAWMFANHSTSLDDCYWTKELDENTRWEDIKLYNSESIDVLQLEKICDKERKYSGINSTLGGSLEKYWFQEKKADTMELRLCKRVDPQNDILCIREILANIICEAMGYTKYIKYDYVFNRDNEIVGCHCAAFTTEAMELVTAYDLLEEYNCTQNDDVYEKIVELAEAYGLPANETRTHLDFQMLLDYLITNRDRHQNNIGFLRDSDSLQFIAVAPIYDSGSSATMEYEKPLSASMTKINGLYHTEMECLEHIQDKRQFNLSQLPQAEKIWAEIDKSKGLSEDRKQFLKDLYLKKLDWLKDNWK